MYGKEPDCEKCMPVTLRPENIEPFNIYQICRNQLIMAGMEGQPVDISIPSVMMVMELYGIKNRLRCFEKVLKMARADIREINEQRKNKRESTGK